jgi:hypothetical protein
MNARRSPPSRRRVVSIPPRWRGPAEGQAARQRARLSVVVVEHRISMPFTVYPVAPSGEQNAPGWTPWAGAGAGAGRTSIARTAVDRRLGLLPLVEATDSRQETGHYRIQNSGHSNRVGPNFRCYVWIFGVLSGVVMPNV